MGQERGVQLLHAKSVTLNKMGDLAYMGGDLATTQRRYEQALELRRSAASSPAGQLDLAASLVKVLSSSSQFGSHRSWDVRVRTSWCYLCRIALGGLDTPRLVTYPLATMCPYF